MNKVDAPVDTVPDQYKLTEEMETALLDAAIEFDEDYDDDYFDNDDDDDDVYDDHTYDKANYLATQLDTERLPPSAEVSFPWLQSTSISTPDANSSGSIASQSAILKPESDVEKNHRLFKQFDVVSDHSGHRFSAKGSKSRIFGRKESEEWSRNIQNEWKLLEKDLPESIFVRVYEERLDLMRAVIVGAHGTPYHDGLFFFDILFPSDYPANPPHFEDLVRGHFCWRADAILSSCKAYMGGSPVGHPSSSNKMDDSKKDN